MIFEQTPLSVIESSAVIESLKQHYGDTYSNRAFVRISVDVPEELQNRTGRRYLLGLIRKEIKTTGTPDIASLLVSRTRFVLVFELNPAVTVDCDRLADEIQLWIISAILKQHKKQLKVLEDKMVSGQLASVSLLLGKKSKATSTVN